MKMHAVLRLLEEVWLTRIDMFLLNRATLKWYKGIQLFCPLIMHKFAILDIEFTETLVYLHKMPNIPFNSF